MTNTDKQAIYINDKIKLMSEALWVSENKVAEIFKEGMLYGFKCENSEDRHNASEVLGTIIYKK